MKLDLSEDQQLMRESFARFLDAESTPARVRANLGNGFDAALWAGLADLGAFGIRVPEEAGGLALGVLDAAVLMEEAGRTLASGPIAEALVAARLLAVLGGKERQALLEKALSGKAVVTIAFHDVTAQPTQWVAGGAVAEAVIARDGDEVVLIPVPVGQRRSEPTLASTPIAELNLKSLPHTSLARGADAIAAFGQALEEWKLLMAAALAGLARESVRLASAYACERVAFGQPIGTYQAISHPLADLISEIEAGKFYVWRTIHDIAHGENQAAADVPLVLWWNASTAGRAVAQSLQTFGGYGLTMEYDIHLYNLRAKAWPLVFGDPAHLLEEAGRRLYAGERASLPDVGAVSIDFDLGAEARALAKETDDFFKKTLTPQLKAKAHYSWEGHDAGVHKKLAEAGLLFPSWPKEAGGRGAPPYAVSASRGVWEDHEWTNYAAVVSGMVGEIIRRYGSEDLKREALAKIAAGEAVCSLGYSEPGSGSDVFSAKTRATPDGNGWRIDGQKMFTSGANFTDYVLMLARTNPDVPKHKGLTMFIVPLKHPGVTVQAVHTFQDERTNITYYDGVKIPDSYRLGEVDGGVKVMSASLSLEHSGGFTKTQAHMLRAGEALCREITYRGKPLIAQTAAQARLARVHCHVALCGVLDDRALWATVENKPAPAAGSMAKMFSSEKFLEDATDLLHLTAPHALSKRKGPAEMINRCYRHAHGTRIYAGTSQVHRSMIAERALGLPRTRA